MPNNSLELKRNLPACVIVYISSDYSVIFFQHREELQVIRTQIQLTEEQSHRLHQAARQAGVSVAELIRQSVDRFLDEEAMAFGNEKGRLAALEVCGRFRSGLSDVAIRHDDYLDEAYLPPALS